MTKKQTKRGYKRTRQWIALKLLDFIAVSSRGGNTNPEYSDSFAFVYWDIRTEEVDTMEEPFRAPPVKAA